MDHPGENHLTSGPPQTPGLPRKEEARSPSRTESKPGSGLSQAPHKDSQIWQNALQRYYEELRKGGYKGQAIDKDLWNIKNPGELLDQIKSLPSSGRWMDDLNTLEKILLSLSDFAAVTAWALGMNGRVAAVIWGSIRLLLNVGHDATAPLTVSLC